MPHRLPHLLPRRRVLVAALAGGLALPAFVRHAAARDEDRFALGVASGQPRPDGMVLWTMLRGSALPEQAEVRWEVAEDEAFTKIVARGREATRADELHSVHAEPAGLASGRAYFYRFHALGATSRVGRTRTAPARSDAVSRLRMAIASCQRWDTGYYAAWRHAAADELDLVAFLGDYIYEYASSPQSLRANEGGLVRTLADYRQRHAQYKGDPDLQAAHAACPWLLVWDDHEVDNDYAGITGQSLQPDFATQRAAAYRAYWEFMPLAKALKPADGSMRMFGRLDWGRLARIHLLDDRQYRDQQACPREGRAGSTTRTLAACPAFADPARSLLGTAQERWLAEGWSSDQPWNLLAQQTLMARFAWSDPTAADGGVFWSDGWDGYAPSRQRLLQSAVDRGVRGLVVLGGDVHAHYVTDLKLDFADPKAAVVGTEFCGTSISSLGLAQSRIDEARRFNPHVHWANGEKRGYVRLDIDPRQTLATLRVLNDARELDSGIGDAARFVVEARQPGAQRA